MFFRLLRTRLAYRSAASILILVGLVGIVFLVVALKLVSDQEQRRQNEQLESLLDTVDNTLRIAVFLGDEELAEEVITGLLSNQAVAAVRLRVGGEELASGGDPDPGNDSGLDWLVPESPALERDVPSPFQPDTRLGSVTLVPNQSVIAGRIVNTSLFVSTLLGVQLVILGIAIVIVVIRHITRPIARISSRLHSLEAEKGEKLTYPAGSEHDEIGRLVNDVNTLIDYLVLILEQERELRIQREVEEQRFRTIFENAESAIFAIDDLGCVDAWNPAFERHFAVTDAEKGQLNLFDLIGDQNETLQQAIADCNAGTGTARLEVVPTRRPGHWLQLTLSAAGDRLQVIANDISERMLAEQEALRRSLTDSLTDLGNRPGFEHRLSRLLRHQREGDKFALLMFDLDHFKEVNDTHGHQAGDQVLRVVAERLRNHTRQSDYLARLGGDEFVVLLEGVAGRQDVLTVADTLLEQLSQPMPVGDGGSVQVGASIGIAFPRPADDVETLFKRADTAMYDAKHRGRNQYQLERDAQ